MTGSESGNTLKPYEDFDPHFRVFHELMAVKISEILLVSSPYDAYIMEEDESITSRIINEYRGLNLSRPPRITQVATAAEALELLQTHPFDLVITMPHLGGMDGRRFGAEVKKFNPDIPVILLTHSVREALLDQGAVSCKGIDQSYIWCCDSEILLTIVKSVEDRLNVDADTKRAMVRVILYVEDSPLYRSRLLPLLYKELVRQTQFLLGEGLNEKHRLLKMRARPKILTASCYEEALRLFETYRNYIFCVISDGRFPCRGKVHDKAGLELLGGIRQNWPDLPLLLLSTDGGNREEAEALPAAFLNKTDKDIQQEIHDFFLRYLGFGDFIFCLPDGTEVGRAANLHQFEDLLNKVPGDSILYHAHRNHFSNWVMARTEIALAARLHRRFYDRNEDAEAIRRDLISKVHALRKLRQRGVVAQFDRRSFDPEIMDFVRIGRGSMGGKGRGLAFMATRLYRQLEKGSLRDTCPVRIPQTCLIASDGFDDFVHENGLEYRKGETDEEIARRFLRAELPAWLAWDLEAFLRQIHGPLSVRSSSLLEDAMFRPYAGLYQTYMLINEADDFECRLRHLHMAIKLVYASTWFAGPRAFSRSIGQDREDSMAVIVQRLVGTRCGHDFFPAISGVVQSWNYYPIGPMRSEDGIAQIAAGFGKAVVEGEQSLRFCPKYPAHLPQFSTVDDILEHHQRWLYTLDCSDPASFAPALGNLVRRPVDRMLDAMPLQKLASTYIPEEHRIRDGIFPGQRMLTFASILKYDLYPLPELLLELITMGRQGMGCEVEIEFAVDLQKDPADSVFYFLQIRPIVTDDHREDVRIRDELRRACVLHSIQSLGHGRFSDLRHVLFVCPETFDPAASVEIAQEIGRLNRILEQKGKSYLLIGPGRWGSADPWLGIPVQWHDISAVGAIVELQETNRTIEPSQGSHFFQNITSLGIPYLVVRNQVCRKGETGNKDCVDWDFFKSLPVERRNKYAVLAQLPEQTVLLVDGHDGEAVLVAGVRDRSRFLETEAS